MPAAATSAPSFDTASEITGVDLAEGHERSEQPVHADRGAGSGHFLASETLDKIIISPAAKDAAELPRGAGFVYDFEGQHALEDRAGVVVEPARERQIEGVAVWANTEVGEHPEELVELVDRRGRAFNPGQLVA